MKKSEKLLIDVTFNLLYKKGYCATNLNDILEKANISKGSLYYHFKSKHDLVFSSAKFYLEHILTHHWVEPLEKNEAPIETLVGQIKLYQHMFSDPDSFLEIRHGCPLSNFILDMSDTDEMFFEYLKDVYTRWKEIIEKALEKAQELNQTNTKFNIEEEAIFIMSAIEGSIGSAKAFNEKRILDSGFKVLEKYIREL